MVSGFSASLHPWVVLAARPGGCRLPLPGAPQPGRGERPPPHRARRLPPGWPSAHRPGGERPGSRRQIRWRGGRSPLRPRRLRPRHPGELPGSGEAGCGRHRRPPGGHPRSRTAFPDRPRCCSAWAWPAWPGLPPLAGFVARILHRGVGGRRRVRVGGRGERGRLRHLRDRRAALDRRGVSRGRRAARRCLRAGPRLAEHGGRRRARSSGWWRRSLAGPLLYAADGAASVLR